MTDVSRWPMRVEPFAWYDPRYSERERETRRRRRRRREALEQAEREYAAGGPLIDAFEPVIGGDEVRHPEHVAAELQMRADRLAVETMMLASYFAEKCWVSERARQAMVDTVIGWQREYGKPGVVPTHSTHAETGTRPTIPMVP